MDLYKIQPERIESIKNGEYWYLYLGRDNCNYLLVRIDLQSAGIEIIIKLTYLEEVEYRNLGAISLQYFACKIQWDYSSYKSRAMRSYKTIEDMIVI